MKVLSLEFTPSWSWGLIFAEMQKHTEIEFKRTFFNNDEKINTIGVDMVLAQNVTLLKKFTERVRTVCRMGGNLNFDSGGKLEPLLKEMAECYSLIATNKKLFKIASSIHDNVHLIPNGIDLEEWDVIKKPKNKKFVVGFCGNITSPIYREYKGYDFVKEACEKIGVELKTALYKTSQIPHEEMQEKFYSKIDCLVHPTKGEGCSNTLMEACALGIPIITTKVAGFHGELMKNEKNVLFCNRTTASIKKAIEAIKKDDKLKAKLSKGSRAFAIKHHDINKIVKEYEKIFNDCIDNSRNVKPSIRFYTYMQNSRGVSACYSINGEKIISNKFVAGLTRKEVEKVITDKYMGIK
jgi:glycosyltransferase involved in cell wall biosynthesis